MQEKAQYLQDFNTIPKDKTIIFQSSLQYYADRAS
jgi:hypothetical protein